MRKLELDAVHRQLGARFRQDLGYELPAVYTDPVNEQRLVREAAGLIDHSYRGVLDLQGAGAGSVLNGLFSSVVSALTPGRGQASTLLSARGRLVGAFSIFCLTDDHYRLVTWEPMREALVNTIKKYVFLSDIDLQDVAGRFCMLSLQGPAGVAILEATGAIELSLEAGELLSVELAGVPCQVSQGGETPEGGFDVWVPSSSAAEVWSELLAATRSAGGGACGLEAAEVLRVEAGAARFGKDYDEESFPNEIGWEHALTYDKCYVGQEIVARMRTYGEVNRRLRGLILPESATVLTGDVVEKDGVEVGLVTSCVRSARLGKTLALALIKRKSWSDARLIVRGTDGSIEGEQVDLPFSIGHGAPSNS